MKKAFLIDGMSMAYKAYFAFISRPLRNSKNQNTSAVYGFLSSLLKILENEKPDYIAVAFDTKEKTFRHDKFPEYKANRQLIPDDMIYQLDYIKKILQAMDIEIVTAPGYEADDIIGTLSKTFKSKNVHSYLVTPDKDFLQLVEDGIYVYKPLKKSVEDAEIYDTKKVEEEYGLKPEQFIDFLALTGDPTDNIPGVKGIGEKTALDLIKEFGSLDNIYQNIDRIKKAALKQKLIDGKEMAYLSRELVTIKRNIPVDVELESLKIKSPDVQQLESLLNELEIKTFNKRLENLLNAKIKSITPTLFDLEDTAKPEIKIKEIDGTNYVLLDNDEKIKDFISKAEKSDLIVFDTETDNLNSIDANLVGLSFCLNKSEAYFYRLDNHKNFDAKENDRKNLNRFKKILEDKSKLKIGQNLKYDIIVLSNYGIDVQLPFFDTMVAAYVLNPDGATGLDDMAKKYLNYDTYKISALIGDKKNSALMWSVPIIDLKIYSCEDADITFQLYEILKEELKAKEVNFGILYGIGPFGLKTRLGISQTAAKELIDRYFKTYKRVHDYLEQTKEFARKNGYVETLKKRRRYLPNINSQNATVRSAEERQAINMPIQGTAADMIKIAMNNISKYFRENKLKSSMIIQVHDELVFEVHQDELDEVKKVVKKEMEDAIKLKVPVKVDIGIGDNWLDAH